MKMLSQVGTIMRGSVGGITYTSNQFASIVQRARVAPVQPNTQGQQYIKTVMNFLSFQWRNLTAEQRAAWDDFAATALYLGPLGTYTVPGRQMMMASVSVPGYIDSRGLLSMDQIFTAPPVAGWLAIGPIDIATPVTPGVGIALSVGNPNDFEVAVFVERSIGFNSTRNRYKGPWVYSTGRAVRIPPTSSAFIEFVGLNEGSAYFTYVRGMTGTGPYKIDGQPTILRHIAETVVLGAQGSTPKPRGKVLQKSEGMIA